MTGEARTASVIAATELEALPGRQAGVPEDPPRARRQIAEQIAEVLASRRTALDRSPRRTRGVARGRVETAKQDLLGKIRGFFGIKSSANDQLIG